jgi:YVTN family beta-propeller protein
VLGPLEVRDGGKTLPLGGTKQRSVLAILLLHAGEVVSRDRLIDLLWGERPPESAPTALHGYVSGLRKVLEPSRTAGAGATVLVTREPGYVLHADPGRVDLERFRRLAERGRSELHGGDHAAAAERLGRALELWRGPPLADLAAEPFARSELGAIEELRAGALEDRVEAELALGRDGALVPELRALVAAEPLRERARGQLMLALYRSGRQADALEVYREGSRLLLDELGLEPSAKLRELERRMLVHDPSLDGSAPAAPAARDEPPREEPAPPPRFPRRAAIGLAAGSAVALAAAVVLIAGSGSGDKASVPVAADSLAAIDVHSNRVVSDVPVGGTPTAVSAGAGAVWVLNSDNETISRVDPATRTARTFGTGATPTDLAAGAGGLWVGNGGRSHGQFVGPVATTVSQIDGGTNAVRRTVSLPRPRGSVSNLNADHIAIGAGGIWVVNADYSVSRLDPRTGESAAQVRTVDAEAIAAGDAGVWSRNSDLTVTRLDRPGLRIRLAATSLGGLAVGAGSVWVTAPYDGTLWRVDPDPYPVERTIAVGDGASAVAFGAGAVWVANPLRGTVTRVDPASNRVTATVRVGGTPRDLAVAGDRVWVSVARGASAPAAPARSLGIATLPRTTCGAPFYGGPGKPDRLIVSDFPLRGGPRLATVQMTEAIELALRQRGFRAGPWRVAYQACDDSTQQTGIFDQATCAANAKAFAATRTVIGEVGPYNSACALAQLPIANRAGPLPMVGPTTSMVDLTREGPASPLGSLARLYPSGRRNFARVFPTEDRQGAALAFAAKRSGARRVFVLSDGGYGDAIAAYFVHAGDRLGLHTSIVRRWNPRARGYGRLAAAVARVRPDAVLVAGLIDTNGGKVVKELRARLGNSVLLLGDDGFLPVSGLFGSAGDAARGMLLASAGLPDERLPAEGKHFVAELSATQAGRRVDEASVYAAQATGVMLDAIARSDGSRASVARALFATRIDRGLTGPARFDSNGDATYAPITILRARRGGGSDAIGSREGSTIESIVDPPDSLVR